MSVYVELKYTNIVSLVHKNVPECVIREIFQCLFRGKFEDTINNKESYELLLHKINTNKSYSIEIDKNGNINAEYYPYIAKFINPSVSWNTSSLLKAFSHIVSYLTPFNVETICEKKEEDYIIGLQTPIHPYAYSACILYSICLKHKINVSFETSIDMMALAVKYILWKPSIDIREQIKMYVRKAPVTELLKIFPLIPYNYLSQTIKQNKPQHTNIDIFKLTNSYPNDPITYEGLLEAINAKGCNNQCEAVARSIIDFSIDVSKAKNPMAEYLQLEKLYDNYGKRYLDYYNPFDPFLLEKWKMDHCLLSLDYTFNPILPVEFYSEKNIRELSIEYGHLESDLRHQNGYELLQIDYLSELFLPGNASNKVISGKDEIMTTPIEREDVNNYSFDQLTTFISNTNEYMVISYRELADLFSHNKNFIQPINQMLTFSPICIRRLQKLCQMKYTYETIDGINDRKNLLYAITQTEIYQNSGNKYLRLFLDTYLYGSSDQKSYISDAIDSLFLYAMSLRGYLGKEEEEYPVKEAPVDNQDEVDLFVDKCMRIAVEKINIVKEKCNIDIYDMPLMIHRNGEYILSTQIGTGLTLGERINIVEKAEQDDTIESCIRKSSNWVTASVCKMYELIGITCPINIDLLREIS